MATLQGRRAWRRRPGPSRRRARCSRASRRAAQGPRAVRDRLRAVGAAAHGHLRRGAAHDHGPPRLRGDLGHPDAARRVLGRPRRDAEGPRQRAQRRDAAAAPAAAADQRAGPVRDARELRRTTTTRCCGGSSTPSGSSTSSCRRTEFYRSGAFDATLLRAAERYDAIMEIMLACLREERQQTYSCFLPIHPETGRVLYVPLKEVNARGRHHHLRRRLGARFDAAGHGRAREAAVEARLRRALGGARRRLRDVRQGPRHQHADLRRHLRGAGRAGAQPHGLRAVPRRGGRQDLQVQGQRPVDRRVADLRLDREPRPTSCTASPGRRSGCTGT